MRKIAVLVIVLMLATSLSSLMASGKDESAGKKIELEVLVWKQEATATYEAWAKAFSKLHPNVTVTYSGVGNYDEQVKARHAAGTLPAVISIPGGNYGFILPKAGVMMDLTNQKFLERVKDGILDGQRLNGKIYSLPIDLAAQGFIYNKKVFRDVGVSVPNTWDELFAAFDKIKAKGIAPLVITGQDQWPLAIYVMTIAAPFVYGPDPNFDMNVVNGKKHFTGPEWTKAMELYAKLLKYANSDFNDLNYGLGNQRVATGEAASVIQGVWAVSGVLSFNKDAELGFFLPPAPDGANKNTMILGADSTIGVNAKHPDREMGLKYVEWLTTPEAVDMWTDINHIFSAMKGAHADFDNVSIDVQKYVDAGVSLYPLVNHMWFLPNVWSDWAQSLQKFNAGKISASDANKALESYLLEAYKVYSKQ
jgi:raffinose/stachyose/melibiose transport system substrate-binding protein